MTHLAIYDLYKNVVTIHNDYDAFDMNGNRVEIDRILVDAEVARRRAVYTATQYQRDRAKAYPDFRDYLDGLVKNDQAQINKYLADCAAVKAKYPKPE